MRVNKASSQPINVKAVINSLHHPRRFHSRELSRAFEIVFNAMSSSKLLIPFGVDDAQWRREKIMISSSSRRYADGAKGNKMPHHGHEVSSCHDALNQHQVPKEIWRRLAACTLCGKAIFIFRPWQFVYNGRGFHAGRDSCPESRSGGLGAPRRNPA